MTARSASLWVAEILVILAAAISFWAMQAPGAISLLLILNVVVFLVGIPAVIYLGVAISDFLGRRGASRVRFPPGEVIFRQGDEGDSVYKIIDGEVEILREDEKGGETALARLGPGAFFGEAALLSNAPRNATVRTLSPVNAVKIARDDFMTLYANLPEIHEEIESAARRR